MFDVASTGLAVARVGDEGLHEVTQCLTLHVFVERRDDPSRIGRKGVMVREIADIVIRRSGMPGKLCTLLRLTCSSGMSLFNDSFCVVPEVDIVVSRADLCFC